ncbi:hypothetical protein D3C80_1075050 [compost metagenome]
MVTCTEERCAWETSAVSSVIMSLKPVSTAPNSSLRPRFRRELKSPVRMTSRIFTIRCIGAMMLRINNKPQMAAAMTATSKESPMLSLASATSETMASVASLVACRLCSITAFKCLRPAIQAGYSSSINSRSASARSWLR